VRCPKVNFISDKDDRDVDSQRTDIWKPVCWDSVEGVGIVDCIHYAQDVCFSCFRFQMWAVVRLGCMPQFHEEQVIIDILSQGRGCTHNLCPRYKS